MNWKSQHCEIVQNLEEFSLTGDLELWMEILDVCSLPGCDSKNNFFKILGIFYIRVWVA